MKLNIGKNAIAPLTYQEVLGEMLDLKNKLMEANSLLMEYALDFAEKENSYLKAKAKGFLLADGKNKEEREAKADAHLANERLEAFKAKAKKETQSEWVKSLRQSLSALQTYVNANKSELDALKYGQDPQI